MEDYSNSGGVGWDQTSLPVKIVLLSIFVSGFIILMCIFSLPTLIRILYTISISRPRWPTAVASITTTATPARVVNATAAVGATTASPVTSSPNNVRLSPEVLASLPTFLHSTTMEGGKGELECSVCLMEFKEGEEGRFLPRCLHRFHAECIDMWFQSHSTCPLCRTVVEIEIF